METKEHLDLSYLGLLAIEAGEIITKNFRKVDRRLKDDGTPVTIVDEAINKLVVDSISRDFPDVSIISEEGNREVSGAELRVFCDPLDGTFPFCLGLPISTFCISVLKENTPLMGLIYDPFCNRVWSAARRKGAFLHGNKIRVSQRDQIDGSQLCLIWWKRSQYNAGKVNDKLLDAGGISINPLSIAIFGGLIGQGLADGSIFPGNKGWETAAMQVIVEEAGGKVTDIHGNKMVYGSKGEIEGHIVSNGFLHDQLVEIVASCQ